MIKANNLIKKFLFLFLILFIVINVINAVSFRSACRSYDGGDLISCNWKYGSTSYSYLVGNTVPQTTVSNNQYFDITYSSSGYETEARSLFFDSRITGSDCLDSNGCTINNGNWRTICHANDDSWHVCNIYYNNEDINYFYVEDSTGIVTFVPYLKTGTNVAPTFGRVGNLTYTEDSGIKNNIYDLWDLVQDDNDADSALTFELISQSNSGLINCYIDSNRYVDCNAPLANQSGTNILTLKATDSKGLSRTQNVNITITQVNDAPTIPTSLSFDSGIYGNTNNSIHLECSGSIDVDSTLYYNILSNISGSWANIVLNDSDGIYNFDISNYSSVSNVGFRCQATDLNLSSSYFTSTNTIEIDDSAPIVFNLIANNVEYGNNNTVSVEVSDKNGVDRVILEVNGLFNYTMNLTSTNIYNYTFVNPAINVYNLKVYAYDSFNNLNNSVIGSFIVNDTIAPVWSPVPSNQTIEFGNNLSYDVNASDLQTVIYSLNDTTNFAIDNVTGLITNNSALSVGVYNLELNATDLNGNINSTVISITVQDTTAPSIIDLLADDVEFDENITFSVNVTDLSGVNRVWVELDNSSIYNLTNVGGDIYNYTLASPSIGSYNFTIYANDSYNNLANISSSFIVDDRIAPNVFGLNATSPVELGNNVIIDVNVTDLTLGSVWIEINGSNQSMSNILNDSYQINLSNLGVGIYPFIIYANDSQNNLNDSVNGSISIVDSTAPSVVGLIYNSTVEYNADVGFSVNVSDLSNISNVYLEYSGTNYSMTDLNLDGVYNYTLNNSNVGDNQSFIIYAIDIYGNVNDTFGGSFNVTDTTAPIWDFVVVNQIVEYGYDFSYDINASDLQTIVYSLNDTTNFAIDNVTGLITNKTILGIGDYNLQVNATDLSGNVNTSNFNITVQDTIVPTWDEVLINQTVEYGDSFSYDVNASDLHTIVYSINDSINFVINSSTGLIENATSLGIGNYSLEINASDGININSSTIVISVVDSVAPTWDEILVNQTVEYGSSFSYDVNASDLNGVIYSINDSSNFVINSSTGLIENVTSLGIGNYSLEINATDLSGNVNNSLITVIVDDTVFPVWSPVPSNQIIELGSSFDYDVNATDLQTIIYSINDSRFNINSSTGLISNNTNLGVGIYNLEVTASDGVNDNSTSFNLTIQDTTNPIVVGLIYNTTVEYDADVEFSVNVSDLSNISNVYLEYSGTNYSMIDLDTDGVYNYTLGSSNVGDNQLFIIYAIDIYGNVNDSVSGSFNVTDNTAPSVMITNSSLIVEYDNDVIVNATISDLSGLDNILLEVNGANYSMINSSLIDYSITVSGLGIGTYPFRIYANDSNGNMNNSENGTITVQDLTAPSIIDLLAGDVEFDGNITFSVNITDLSGVNRVWIELDNSSIYNLTNIGGDIYNYTLASPSIGNYNFTIYANDSYNNLANITSSFIVDDSIAPNVFGLNATSPVELGNNVIINVNVTDLTLDSVWIEINGSNQSMSNILNDSYQINLSGLEVGIYPFIIYANDSQNNLNNSVSGSVSVVDNTAPSVVGLIYNSTVEYDADVEFSVNVSDLSNISNVYLEYSGTNYSMTDLDSDGVYNYTLGSPNVGDNQLFTIYAIDIYGNVNNSESGSFNVTDGTNPVTILISASSPIEYDGDVNITVNASDLNLASVWVEINSSNLSMSDLGNNIYNLVVQGLGVGTYPFTVYANDSYGNLNNSVGGSVSIVDTTSPVFENISYLGSVEYDNNLSVLVNISDLSLIDSVLFEYSGTNYGMSDLGNGIYNYTLVSPIVGDNQLFTIYVNDSYNNSNSVIGQFNVTEITVPEVVLVSAPSSVEYDNDIVVNVTASDLSGIDTVLLEIDGTNYTMINSSLINYSITVSGLGVGTYPFTIYANDSYGNLNDSLGGSVSVVDTTSPVFENISYLGSVEYDNNLFVLANISDLSLIDSVLFEYNGNNFSMQDLDFDGVYNYTLISPIVGDNQLFTIYVNDSYGNSNSVVGQFNVTDTNGPTWDEVLVNQSVELGDNFVYNVNASDLNGVIYSVNDTVNFAIDNLTGLITNNTALGIGNYSLEINASDGVNVNSVSIIVSVVDTTSPIWSPVPSNQTVEYGDSFSYDVDANDLNGVVYSINDSSNFMINSSTGLIVNTTNLGIGNYSLEVNASDLSGNVNSSSFSLTVEDTIAPIWDEVLVDQNVELGDSFVYDVNASDLSGIVYSINDSSNFVINSSTGLIENATSLGIGNYSLEINASDLSGNVNSSNIVVRVGDFTAPTVVGLVYNLTVEYNADVEFYVNVTDLNGISNVYLEYVGNNYSMLDLDFDGVYNYTLVSPNVGSNQLFTIYAIDNSGNVNDSVSGSFNVTDITSPVWDFAVVNQTIELGDNFVYDVNASDLQTVIYSINDSRFNINSSGTITNNSALFVGVYNLEVTASDGTNNNVTSFNLTVEDTTAPLVTNSVVPITVLENESVNITVDVYDVAGVDNVIAIINNGTNNTSYNMSLLSAGFVDTYNLTLTGMVGGNYDIVYNATDVNGNYNDSVTDSFYVVDVNVAPVIDVFTPVNATVFSEGDTLEIIVNASDLDGNIPTIRLYNNQTQVAMSTTGNLSYNYTFNNTDAGNYIFTAVATDGILNDTVTREYVVNDKAIPDLSSVTPDGNTVLYGSQQNISVLPDRVIDTGSVVLIVNGIDVTGSAVISNTSINYSATDLVNGVNYVNVTASDLLGNTESYNWTFVVDLISTVTGSIVDNNGNGIGNANVTVTYAGNSSYVDSSDVFVNGVWKKDFDLSEGSYTLTFAADGYSSDSTNITVDGHDEVVNFTLYKAPNVRVTSLSHNPSYEVEYQDITFTTDLSYDGNIANDVNVSLYFDNGTIIDSKNVSIDGNNATFSVDLVWQNATVGNSSFYVNVSMNEDRVSNDNIASEFDVSVVPIEDVLSLGISGIPGFALPARSNYTYTLNVYTDVINGANVDLHNIPLIFIVGNGVTLNTAPDNVLFNIAAGDTQTDVWSISFNINSSNNALNNVSNVSAKIYNDISIEKNITAQVGGGIY